MFDRIRTGITLDEYLDMSKKQSGHCGICKKKFMDHIYVLGHLLVCNICSKILQKEGNK